MGHGFVSNRRDDVTDADLDGVCAFLCPKNTRKRGNTLPAACRNGSVSNQDHQVGQLYILRRRVSFIQSRSGGHCSRICPLDIRLQHFGRESLTVTQRRRLSVLGVSRRAFASACDFIVAYFNQASDAHSQGKAMHSSWALSHGAENEILYPWI
ncbi:hypothetical protein PC117_g25041 [Phytophthora cactorum]|uniref:Uncharacterized protein n=1 Tax=Phytophthora cactorum TaxID=29920 RepID=A0A8T1AQR6_9STRA|nr:hypothetical protein PC117_g25041 [Phytophthora cactorum]